MLIVFAVGCHNDGLTSQQRFELRKQQSAQNHEWQMAAQRSNAEWIAKQMPATAPTAAPAAP